MQRPTSRTRRTSPAPVLLALLSVASVGCAQPGPPSGDQAGATPRTLETPTIGRAPLSVASVGVNATTITWANTTPSQFDGLPIGPPGPRFREALGMLQERLAAAPMPPKGVVWDFLFPRASASNETPATQYLADHFAASPFPMVIIREHSTQHEERLYDGPRTMRGHGWFYLDCEVRADGLCGFGNYFAPMETLPDLLIPPHPLSTIGLSAALWGAGLAASAEKATARASDITWELGEPLRAVNDDGSPGGEYMGVRVRNTQVIPPVTLQAVLTNDAARDSLANRVVVVGVWIAPYDPPRDYLQNGGRVAGPLAHAWGIQRALNLAANAPDEPAQDEVIGVEAAAPVEGEDAAPRLVQAPRS